MACQTFDASDGLPRGEFAKERQPVCARDALGQLGFATSKGVAMIDPAELRLNEAPPPVHIEGVSFYRRLTKTGERPARRAGASEIETQWHGPFSARLALPAGSRRITIQYTGLCYAAPEKTRFQVKLEGEDADWVDAGTMRTAYYHELAPKTYQFRVRAAGNDNAWNEAGTTFGWTRAEVLGRMMAETLIPERDREFHRRGLRKCLTTGEGAILNKHIDFMALHQDGHEFPVELSITPIQAGDQITFSAFIRDISERKQAEASAQRARAELAHAARVSTMGALAGSLVHELNQPLTAILSNAQAGSRFLAVSSPDVAEVQEVLRDIAVDTKRAGGVIRQLRKLVKKDDLQFEALDLNQLIHGVVRLLHSEALIKNVQLQLDLQAELGQVRGDAVQLQQVLLNLLLNAFDAMIAVAESKRIVHVRTRQLDTEFNQVEVSDGGTGFPPELLAQLFEPFRTTKRDGLGLGLYISRSIVETHGGRLWALNNQNQGATLCFTVPSRPGRTNNP